MDVPTRQKTISELKKEILVMRGVIFFGAIALAALAIKIAFQTEIIIQRTPGVPNQAVFEKTTMDKNSQLGILYSLTNNIAQVNPTNAEYIKPFIQAFLAPQAYTRVTKEIDAKVAQLVAQRELGSYYAIMRGYDYDPEIDTHFIRCDVHVVNAAIDTAKPYIFEYKTHVENYGFVVDDVKAYEGDAIHNSQWIKNKTRKS